MFLFTDLDRTLLPNGAAQESPQARAWFAVVAGWVEVSLVYVSGRNLGEIEAAVAGYALPEPAYAIADVGASIYHRDHGGEWSLLPEWQARMAAAWDGREAAELAALFADVAVLTPQEGHKQSRFKACWYTPPGIDHAALIRSLQGRLAEAGLQASLIWSLDDGRDVGLLDLLPPCADKAEAIDFLRHHLRATSHDTLFAGDSGNDLAALLSGQPAVLVANGQDAVRAQAVAAMGPETPLYFARGGFLGMNGNYAAGILEGLAHFYPDLGRRLQTLAQAGGPVVSG